MIRKTGVFKMTDYILKVDDDLEIIIEMKQKSVRKDVITQYVSCRKDLQMTQTDIANILGTKVNISKGRKKGKIEIEYYNDDDLNNIISLLIEE